MWTKGLALLLNVDVSVLPTVFSKDVLMLFTLSGYTKICILAVALLLIHYLGNYQSFQNSKETTTIFMKFCSWKCIEFMNMPR